MACGDGGNDIPMLKVAGIGVAMGNASETVKASADFVTDTVENGSVVILGGLSLVNSLHAYTFASLKRKKLISTTPLNDALNALILALNASAAAFVLLFTKKFRILS